MPDQRKHWEERYSATDREPGAPSAFVLSVLPDRGSGRALDLACGDGRHAIAMAQRGYAVTAIDLSHAGLARLRNAARGDRLAIDVVQADLEAYELPLLHFDVAVVTFYLQRSIFAPVKESLVPGGIAIVETFLTDQKEIGHPRNPAFLLDRGELRDRFSEFEILACEEGLFATGRDRAYLSRLAARKPQKGTQGKDRH